MVEQNQTDDDYEEELSRLRRRVAELETASEELSSIFNLSLDMICIADIHRQTFLKTNPAFHKILGYTEEELVNRPFSDFTHPEDIAKTDVVVEEQLRQGKEVIDFENRYRCKDGTYRWLSWVSRPNVAEGKAFAVARDITEWKLAAQQLESNKRLLDSTSRMAHIGGWELNAETMAVTWTEGTYHIHEVPLDYEPPLEKAIEFFHPDDREELGRAIQEALALGKPYDLELRFITAKGRHRWTRTKCEPEFREGEVVKLRGLLHDITERKQAEEERERLWHQLQQAQKMDALGTLAGGIAHDFNNVLVAIMGFSELALDELEADHVVRDDIVEITKAATKARALVRQILTYSRKSRLETQRLDLDDVVIEGLTMLERTVPKMIRLEFDRAQEAKPITANAQQLEQVVLNLGSNAADAMSDGGTVKISTRIERVEDALCDTCGEVFSGEFAVLRFEDSGSGISPAVRSKIFDPFFTTKSIGKGTGLGLSTVLGIVNAHDGHLQCDSEEGVRTIFRIYLPLATSETTEGSEERDISEEEFEDQGDILVVDDDDAARRVAERILSRSGYTVVSACSGEEALETYRGCEGNFDVVVLDLGMPGMGGRACLVELLERDPEVKVLIASGYIHSELSDELKSIGARAVVSKPYGRQELLQRLRELLS